MAWLRGDSIHHQESRPSWNLLPNANGLPELESHSLEATLRLEDPISEPLNPFSNKQVHETAAIIFSNKQVHETAASFL